MIPGGVQHNLAFNYPFPLAVERAEGAHLWDVDGNRYIDFLQAGGPTILGSNYAPVRERVKELLDHCGPVTGLFHEYETKLAALVRQFMPSVEMLRLLGSGTEAVMGAIRLARAHTGKKWVIKIGGAYHGWSDQVVYGLKKSFIKDFTMKLKKGDTLITIDPVYYRPTEVDLLIGDPTKAKKVLGWKAKTKFEDLIKLMIKSDMEKVLRRGY